MTVRRRACRCGSPRAGRWSQRTPAPARPQPTRAGGGPPRRRGPRPPAGPPRARSRGRTGSSDGSRLGPPHPGVAGAAPRGRGGPAGSAGPCPAWPAARARAAKESPHGRPRAPAVPRRPVPLPARNDGPQPGPARRRPRANMESQHRHKRPRRGAPPAAARGAPPALQRVGKRKKKAKQARAGARTPRPSRPSIMAAAPAPWAQNSARREPRTERCVPRRVAVAVVPSARDPAVVAANGCCSRRSPFFFLQAPCDQRVPRSLPAGPHTHTDPFPPPPSPSGPQLAWPDHRRLKTLTRPRCASALRSGRSRSSSWSRSATSTTTPASHRRRAAVAPRSTPMRRRMLEDEKTVLHRKTDQQFSHLVEPRPPGQG